MSSHRLLNAFIMVNPLSLNTHVKFSKLISIHFLEELDKRI